MAVGAPATPPAAAAASPPPTALEGHVGRKYRVGHKIGSGSFGEIYFGTNVATGKEVAIKMESRKKKNPHLLFESRVYKILSNAAGIPEVYWYGVEGDYCVMVMELLGPSLEDLFCYCGRKFRLKTVLMLADQMLHRIETVHSLGFLHRDIKPHNFLIGRKSQQSTIYIIDFGLAKRYRHPANHIHILYREGKSLTGTARYVSINTHMGLEQSRRDDLESLGYVFLYFVRGSLPWQGLKATSKRDKYDKIRDKKVTTSVQQLCKYLAPEFAAYINYCRSLKFVERPDYTYLRQLIKDLLTREGLYFDFLFDWCYIFSGHAKTSNAQPLLSTQQQLTDNRDGALANAASLVTGQHRQRQSRKTSERQAEDDGGDDDDDNANDPKALVTCKNDPSPCCDDQESVASRHRSAVLKAHDTAAGRSLRFMEKSSLRRHYGTGETKVHRWVGSGLHIINTSASAVASRRKSHQHAGTSSRRAVPGTSACRCSSSETSHSVLNSSPNKAAVAERPAHRPIATSPATVKTTTSQPPVVHPARARPGLSLLFSSSAGTRYSNAVQPTGTTARPAPTPLQSENNGIAIY